MAQVFQLDDHINPQILRLPKIHPSHHRGQGGEGWSFQAWKMMRKCVRYKRHVATKLEKMTQKIHPKLLDFTSHPQSEALCSCQAWRLFLRLPTVMATTPMVSETARERGRTQLTWKAQLWSSHPMAKDEEKIWRHQVRWLEKTTPCSRLLGRSIYKLVSKSSTTFFSKRKSLWRKAWWNWISHMQLHWKEASMVLVQGNHRFSNSRLATPRKSDWVRGWAQRWQTVKKSILPNRKLFRCFQTMSSSGWIKLPTHPNSCFKWAQSRRTKANQGNSLLHPGTLKQPVFSNGSLFGGTNKCFIRHGFGIIPN